MTPVTTLRGNAQALATQLFSDCSTLSTSAPIRSMIPPPIGRRLGKWPPNFTMRATLTSLFQLDCLRPDFPHLDNHCSNVIDLGKVVGEGANRMVEVVHDLG